MRARVPGRRRWIKRLLPRSLLGRSLLMILVPLVLLQAVALQIFYGSHLDIVSRRLSGGVAGEIAYTLDLCSQFPDAANREWILADARATFRSWTSASTPARSCRIRKPVNILGPMDDDLAAALKQTFTAPFTMDWTSDPHSVLIRMQIADGVLDGRRAAQAAVYRHDLSVRGLGGRHRAAAVRHRRDVHAQPGARDPPPGERGRGVRHRPRHSGRSGPKARRKCARPPPRSTACRSASAASWRNGPRCWPACRTTCARR